jgi:small-conductance mechanosensitive channel
VFDCPVYNYTHEFAYLWDEMSFPVHFHQDFDKAERIILEAASDQARTAKRLGEEEVKRLEERFGINTGEIDPKVFWRVTEDWLEMTVRFLGPDHGIRHIKDQMTRQILSGFETAGILIAATRQEGVNLQPKTAAASARR